MGLILDARRSTLHLHFELIAYGKRKCFGTKDMNAESRKSSPACVRA